MKISELSLIAVLALGSLLTLGTLATAQEAAPKKAQTDKPQSPGQAGSQERFKKLAEYLGLSDDQKDKIKAIYQEQGEKMQALRDDTSLSQEDKQAKFKAIREGSTAKIKAILTTDQQAKFDQATGSAQDRFKKMAEDLGLSDDQKEKLKTIFQEQAEKMKALRDDTSLSQEDKQAKFKDIQTAGYLKIKDMLTTYQQDKYDEIIKDMQNHRKQPPEQK